MDESPFLQLLDLKPKEEVELTDHGHLEFPSHHVSKFFAKSRLVEPNMISST